MRQNTAATRDPQHRGGEIKALYFDGRHDQTSTGRGGDMAAEEHVAVVAEPRSEHVTHFTPVSDKATGQVNELLTSQPTMWRLCPRSGLWRRGCQHGEAGWHLSAFWNHSRKSSAFVCLSIASKPTSTERTVPWVGWQNGRELNELDGSVHRLSPVEFSPVSVPEPGAAWQSLVDLSSDQLLLYIHTSSPKEACKKIGPLIHARCCSPHRAD